jgi:hypothetical protein
MQLNLIKSAVIASMLAVSSIAATPASAGNVQFELHVGGHPASNFRHHRRGAKPGYHRGWRNGNRGHRAICQPRAAIWKAHRIGLRHAGVQRIMPNRIVVAGRHRGHHARIVFDRTSHNCRIIAKRGI